MGLGSKLPFYEKDIKISAIHRRRYGKDVYFSSTNTDPKIMGLALTFVSPTSLFLEVGKTVVP